MATARRAVIDVGTNSVKLLVAEVAGCQVHPLLEAGNQTRLGQEFYATHRLQPAAIARTAAAVAEFAATARQHGATHVRVFATSAVRDATNAPALTDAIEQKCGVQPEVISGEREAEWAFRGATTNPALAREPLLLLEVGGGSTQFIVGQGEAIHFRESFPLGAVRLLERFPHSDPPTPAELKACRDWLGEFLDGNVRSRLAPALRREVASHARQHAVRLVGTGGTATVLARMELGLEDYDREKIEAVRLTRPQLQGWVARLWSLPLADRRHLRGLPPERADVVLTGAAIYAAVLEGFDFAALRVSTRGLRFAAVMEGA
jgi:exopolyphosphatase/guanosine-5'-triphosphate,3'-diphosphate pyrophosphatase